MSVRQAIVAALVAMAVAFGARADDPPAPPPLAPPPPPPAPTWAGSPEIRSLLPTGAQRGTSVTFTFVGERLGDAKSILFLTPGIALTKLANVDERTVQAECAIAADAPLGEHPLRLRTAGGLTDVVTLWVGALPVVAEIEPNGDMASAQRIAIDTTVAGVITREDADWFAVEAKAGERLTVEVEAMRLGRAMFDPAIAILDAKRFEIGECDDSALLRQDATVSVRVPTDGTYFVTVRDAAYGGSDTSHYRLHITKAPRPKGLWPPAIAPGATSEIHALGDPLESPAIPVTGEPGRSQQAVFFADACGVAPSPNTLRVSEIPLASDPVEAGKEPSPPIAFHGVIAEPGALNRHRFRAKAGEVLKVALHAQRIGSPLDAVLEAYREDGSLVGVLDDTVGSDPEIQGPVDKDGVYELRVRDHRKRGGPAFAYRIEVAPPRPTISLSLERVDNRRPQFLQAFSVPRGGRFAAMLRAERTNIAGETTIEVLGLPAGVTARALPIAADLPNAPIIIEAAPDAPLADALLDLRGRCGPSESPVRGGFDATVPLVIGQPNDTIYYETRTDRLALAVTEPPPFRVRLVPPASPLLRVGAKSLAIAVERDPGFTADVTLHMLWNPPGVSSANAITVNAQTPVASYPLNATGDAPLKRWPIAILAHANVRGGDVWLSSDLVELKVADAFERGTTQLAATERGKPAAFLCALEPVRPFDGKATVTLLGLPPNSSAAPREITSDMRELVFEVATREDTPIGQHRGLFCELSLTLGGEVVTHRFAFDGVLRVDAPPPAPVATAAAPAPAPPPTEAAPPQPKPLSRLEQLRQREKKGAP